MNSLDLALNEYIAIRRALGFELREVAGCLRNFIAFLNIDVGRLHDEFAPLRHGIARIHAQIDDDLLDLPRITFDAPESWSGKENDFNT